MKQNTCECKIMRLNELENSIEIPRFQRQLVWKKKDKKEFIDSIRKGFPIGTLLLYFNENIGKYELIDGLQRFSTLLEFKSNRKDFYTKIPFENELTKLKELYLDYNNKTMNEQEILEFNSYIYLTLKNCNSPMKYTKHCLDLIKSQNKCYCDEYMLSDIVSDIFQVLIDDIDVDLIDIPVLIYRGDRTNLPEIFEKLNSSGTKLTKYDIFAASWNKELIYIDDDEIINIIYEKYKNLSENTNLEISEEYSNLKKSKEINLYEYCYALSQVILKQNKPFFSKIKNKEGIGFVILMYILGGNISNLENLPNYIKLKDKYKISKMLIDIKFLVKSLINEVFDILDTYIKFNNDYYFAIENQIVAILITYLRINYNIINSESEFKITNKTNNNILLNKFKIYMPFRYLYETINDEWKSGTISSLKKILSFDIVNSPYTNYIKKADWENILRNWLDEEIKKESSRTISSKTKLFLIYLMKLNGYPITIDYELEHIIPISRLRNNLTKGAFSATANICFLPKEDNRLKSNLTIYEYKYNKTSVFDYSNEKLENLFYPKEENLAFIINDNFTKEMYENFLKHRNDDLILKFKILYNIKTT